jgi:hypothetical protein
MFLECNLSFSIFSTNNFHCTFFSFECWTDLYFFWLGNFKAFLAFQVTGNSWKFQFISLESFQFSNMQKAIKESIFMKKIRRSRTWQNLHSLLNAARSISNFEHAFTSQYIKIYEINAQWNMFLPRYIFDIFSRFVFCLFGDSTYFLFMGFESFHDIIFFLDTFSLHLGLEIYIKDIM